MFSAHKFTLLLTTTIHGYSQVSLLSIPSPSHTVSSSLVYPTDTTSSISKSAPYHPKFHLCLPDYQLPPNVSSHQRLIRGLGISISQCLPLHTWDNNDLFPFREKGKETKKHYCKVSLPFFAILLQVQFPSPAFEKMNCCSSPPPRSSASPGSISSLSSRFPFLTQYFLPFSHPLYWENENYINWRNIFFLMSVFKTGIK